MDLNNFGPFSTLVWGSVSDWAIVAVTGISLYYLRKTLDSQREVQKDQTDLTRIERSRYVREIMPSFNLKVLGHNTRDEDNRIYISFTKMYFICNNNYAYNFDLVPHPQFTSSGEWVFPFKNNEQPFVLPNEELFYIAEFQGEIINDEYLSYVQFILKFADSEQNKYSQIITLEMLMGEPHVVVNAPVLS